MQIFLRKEGNFLIINTYYKNKNVRIYQCDNLNLLKQLPDNYIDLIYCDILYGTGRKFTDYQDLKPDLKIINNYYIPRIKEIHRVLKNTGQIYLQMDYRINHWIRFIMDDIFGYENFRNEIIYIMQKGGSPKYDLPLCHDIILRYSKSNKYILNKIYVKHKDSADKRYDKIDENGKRYKIYKKGEKEYRSYYKGGKLLNDVWDDINLIVKNSEEYINYDTQKPKALLERIIKISSNEGDIVADFFMGSGTTGEVALELNRKFIGCDIGERACEITKEKLEKTIQNY